MEKICQCINSLILQDSVYIRVDMKICQCNNSLILQDSVYIESRHEDLSV